MKRSNIKRGPGNPIPPERYEQVVERQHGVCLNCSGRGSEVHHRRGRAVKDEHTHCSCNMVLLCGTCHRWAHAGTVEMRRGFRLPRYVTQPRLVDVISWHGKIMLNCDGTFTPVGSRHPT